MNFHIFIVSFGGYSSFFFEKEEEMFIYFLLLKNAYSMNDSDEECQKCMEIAEPLSVYSAKIDGNIFKNQIIPVCKNNDKCSDIFFNLSNSIGRIMFRSRFLCEKFKKCRPTIEPLSIEEPNYPKNTNFRAQLHSDDDNDPDGNCAYCKSIFDFLTGEALQDTTVPVFMKLVKTMCDNLPPASAICEQVTNHHVEKLIMLVTSKFESQELCQSAGFCQPKN